MIDCRHRVGASCDLGLFGGRPNDAVCTHCLALGGPARQQQKPSAVTAPLTAAGAVLFGSRVDDERHRRRLDVCRRCEFNRGGRCGRCGCGLGARVLDLARFEETRFYGCKHPRGSRWIAAGV